MNDTIIQQLNDSCTQFTALATATAPEKPSLSMAISSINDFSKQLQKFSERAQATAATFNEFMQIHLNPAPKK